jgi:UDP:flavonoid glycosyltransferase YjiC (YdhE family)
VKPSLNFILFSVGSGGDVMPFVQIGRRLTQRGHRVTLFSHCQYEETAKRASLELIALDTAEEYAEFVADQHLLNGPEGIPRFIRRHALAKVIRHYELIADANKAGNTIAITRDLFDTAPRLAAEKLALPLRWIFGNPLQAATWKLRERLFADLLRSDVDRIRVALGLPRAPDAKPFAYCGSANPGLWPEWFAASDPGLPFEVVPVGFVIDKDARDGEIPRGINDAIRSCATSVLISAGTGMYLADDFYAASAEACRRLNVLGILVAQHGEQLPGDYPGCIKWIGYLPFGKLMREVKAVIHHGGIGTLANALAAGVPQLVLAKGADRPDNAARLKELGVAEFLPPPKWQPSIIADALLSLIQSQAVRESCRELAGRMKDSDSVTAACEVLEQARDA